MSFINFLSPIKLVASTQTLFNQVTAVGVNLIATRLASKKTGGSTKNKKGRPRPKHRKIRCQDGTFVQKGTLLVTQNKLRCHPGLNVGLGRNGTLFAMEAGKVIVSCEKVDLDMDHSWNRGSYEGRPLDNVYKKYFHVLPLEQHFRFKKIS